MAFAWSAGERPERIDWGGGRDLVDMHDTKLGTPSALFDSAEEWYAWGQRAGGIDWMIASGDLEMTEVRSGRGALSERSWSMGIPAVLAVRDEVTGERRRALLGVMNSVAGWLHADGSVEWTEIDGLGDPGVGSAVSTEQPLE